MTRDEDRFGRDARYDRYDRYDRPGPSWRHDGRGDFGPRRYRPSWVMLSAPLRLGPDGREAVVVNDRHTFTQLRLQAAGRGMSRIERVIVRFADGSRQVEEVDRLLDRRGEMLDIPLDGNNRRIDRIVVIGEASRRGAVQVFGI